MDTTAEILDACIFLGKKDVKVTVNSVREYRGFGSNSTIGPIVALYNRNSEMFKAGEAPASLKLSATAALDKVFVELKEKMISEIDTVLSSKEELSVNHNAELKRRSDELQELLTEKTNLRADLKKSQDFLKVSEDKLTKSVKASIELVDVNSNLEDQLDSLEKSLKRCAEEKKLNNHTLNELKISLALSEEKKNHIAKELTEKTDMIKALNLSFRDAAEKREAKDKANGEALAMLNKDLSTADKALSSTKSELVVSKDKLAISEDKLAISADKLQVLVAEIATLKGAESACRDSLHRQKIWFGKVLQKSLSLVKKNKVESAKSLLGDAIDAHDIL
tara:strand:- start:4833 stop:5840 length:1008 start_codon:yes stop_codon:yes gene_type:complete